MSKLLVNAPSGAQELIEVGVGGGYFDASRVLWDERTDGPLPEITLGGMVRDGSALVFSQGRMDEHLAALAPPIPRFVTPRQGRAILIKRGHLAQIQSMLDAMTGLDGELARNDFAASTEWFRSWPLIDQMRVALGWTSAYVDELFTEAAKL